MGDSDDEFDRRRAGRDKFRNERYESYERSDRRGGRDGGWEDRDKRNWNRDRRDSYREDYRQRRERYSPHRQQDVSPPVKRQRRDWDEGGGGGGAGGGGAYQHYEGGYGGGAPPSYSGPPPQGGNWHGPGDMPPPAQPPYGNQGQRGPDSSEFPTQPAMMSFKAYLSSQDDNITDEEAIKKYNEYKLEFRKQQISEFFLAHKDEEWFRSKYHPEECDKRHDDQCAALQFRCDVFMRLVKLGRIDATSCDIDKGDELTKLLDAAVLLLEGGEEFDLNVLDEEEPPPRMEPEEDDNRSRHNSENQQTERPDRSPVRIVTFDKKNPDQPELEEGEEDDDPAKMEDNFDVPVSPEQEVLEKKAQEYSEQTKNDVQNDKKKRHRDKSDYSYESGSDSESGSASDSEGEHPPGMEPPPPGLEGLQVDGPPPEEFFPNKEDEKEVEKDEDTKEEEEGEHVDIPKPRALHKTSSIFLRNLAPTITKQEVEAMCKRFPGFMRVALQDPQPERRFFRRGWVTFDRTVNIKDICWNLNNIRLRDCDMGAIVNRELRQRVRPINGIMAHKQVAKQDVKHLANIVQNLDQRWKLWEEAEEEKKDKEKEPTISLGLVSKNPVLKNITDHLVDEGSYEEDAYMGESLDDKPKEANPEVKMERDEVLLKVIDRMVLYLRIVHSFDYYSGVEYPHEDEMPHRCGIMHVRGNAPPNRIIQSDIADWLAHLEQKVAPFLSLKVQLDDEEAKKLGKKDVEAELEKFVTANTQELAKDKWLCPLSGKKFKGPEFVRKHIFNKHAEKVEEVKQEVAYYNNFMIDPKRPMLPDHPANRGAAASAPGPPQRQEGGSGYNNYSGGGGSSSGGGGGGSGYHQQAYGSGGYNRGSYNYRGRGNRGYRGGYGQNQYHSPNYQGRGGYNDRGGYQRQGDNYRGGSGGGGGGGGGGSDRFYQRRDRSRQDPRGLVEYRDLDAPDDGDIF